MPDIYFTCKTCGKGLFADDALTGLTADCPGCNTSNTIPRIVIVHQCPQCGQVLKYARDMKDEVIDCPSCHREIFLPGKAAAPQERLLSFVCPKCGVEIEAPEEMAGQSAPCPSCDEEVHLRPKLRLRTEAKFLTSTAEDQQPLAESHPTQLEPPQPRKRVGLLPLLRYGLVDILFLVLFLIPLPALNGHNFFYVLRLSITGSQPSPPFPLDNKPANSRTANSLPSGPWRAGFEAGQNYGQADRDAGLYDHRVLGAAERAMIAIGYTRGTTEYNEFWDGYRRGYADKR